MHAIYNQGNHEVDIWSLATKKIINHYQSTGESGLVFAWSPDEHFVAIAYTDQEEKITTWKIVLPQ